jgi:hypothetical protein
MKLSSFNPLSRANLPAADEEMEVSRAARREERGFEEGSRR